MDDELISEEELEDAYRETVIEHIKAIGWMKPTILIVAVLQVLMLLQGFTK